MVPIHNKENRGLGGSRKSRVVLIEAYVHFENFIFQPTSTHHPFHFIKLWDGNKPS